MIRSTKFKPAKIPITDFINRNKIISLIIHSSFHLFFSAIRKINRLFTYNNGNVIVISLHRLGDTVFTIPAIREIQKFYRRKMIVVCFPESIPIYNLAFNDIDFRVIERGDFYFGKRIAKSKAKKKLKSLEPQIIFDLTGSMVSASLIFSIRAREIIGMNNNQFKKIYDYFTPVRNIPHLMDMYLDATALFTSLSYKESIKYFPVNIINDGKIMIHPLAGWKAKEWNFNNFFKLAINLAEHHKVCMIIPINKISDDVVNELMEGNVEVIQTRSLEELIEHIKLCSVFISNDSGPLYIASLLGKPNFSIYGPTNPEFSRPFGTNHQFIVQSLKCSPEKNKQYCFTYAGMSGCPSFECMKLLTVEEVYNGLIPLINKYCHSIVE